MELEAFRLEPGADLKFELEKLVSDKDMKAAFVLSCVGSLSSVHIRMPGVTPEERVIRKYNEPVEIVSLVGTFSVDGSHLHIAFSRNDGSCIGGHMETGCIVRTTAEIVICEIPHLTFRRPLDSKTGFDELSVHRRVSLQ